ncbi:MAG: glycoside hydrolase family 3 N-terminal domain-containing protein, partial [Acidimicrobiales bacterium]
FGSDPERVAALVHAVVTGMRRAGVLTVAKHFPGKGEARVDPHHQLPVLDLSRERLERIEWVPFRAARDAGVDAVMMGHYALPQITGRPDLPSSVAREVVDQVLRIDMGFDGLVITDALDMGALSQGGGSLLEGIAALRAGVDLLLCSADLERAEQLARGVNLAHDRGLIDQFTISESLRRSSAARSRVGPQRPALDVVAGQPHQQLSAELAAKAITLVRDRDDLLPVPTDAKILSVMVHPTDLTPADTSSCEPPRMAEALSARFTHVDGQVVDYVPSAESVHRAVRACADADVAVVGTITANAAQAEMVRAISSQVRTITVALRTPFDLLTYPQVGTHLCSYSLLEPSLLALAGAIHGDPVSGTLPVDIGDLHRRGEGMRQGHQ